MKNGEMGVLFGVVVEEGGLEFWQKISKNWGEWLCRLKSAEYNY
jgi:hypothetical protein